MWRNPWWVLKDTASKRTMLLSLRFHWPQPALWQGSSHTMCAHRERNPGIVSTSTDSTMGGEMLRTSENSSPGFLGCAYQDGAEPESTHTPKAPLPAWKHVAPTPGCLLQSPRPPQKIPQGLGLRYLLSPSCLPNR